MTPRIVLIYKITPDKVWPPDSRELERKDRWLEEIKSTVPSEWEPKHVKVAYEIYDPETDRISKFFNGPIVMFWAIQAKELTQKPETRLMRQAREELLDGVLGYDLTLVNKTVRRRKSTSNFKSVQQWLTLVETIREQFFEPSGYTFPDSEEFQELEKKHGHEEATRIEVERLIAGIKRKSV